MKNIAFLIKLMLLVRFSYKGTPIERKNKTLYPFFGFYTIFLLTLR